MKRINFILITLMLFTFNRIYSQDSLLLKNNSKLLVIIQEIGSNDIMYRNYINQDGMTFSIDKSDVDYIIYAYGYKQKIEVNDTINAADIVSKNIISDSNAFDSKAIDSKAIDSKVIDGNGILNSSNKDMFILGQFDATHYYKGYRGASTGTLVVSLLSPLVGLIPAIACSSTTPKLKNLDYPDSQIFQKIDYQRGYISQSKKIKSKKVWRNWSIALGVNVILVVLSQQ
jgi:hypothetical protein